MESLNPWLLLIAGLLVGALVGGLVILLMERRNRGSDHDIRAARRELEDYRQDVAEHYAETAKRVNALTHSYKAVYDHLEDGAYKLVGEEELRRRLDDRAAEPVTLEGIGQRGLQRPAEPSYEYEEHEPGTSRSAASSAAAGTLAGVPSAATSTDVTAAEGTPASANTTGSRPGDARDAGATATDDLPGPAAYERPADNGTRAATPAPAEDADLTASDPVPADERPREGYAVDAAADPNASTAAAAGNASGSGDRDAEDELRHG